MVHLRNTIHLWAPGAKTYALLDERDPADSEIDPSWSRVPDFFAAQIISRAYRENATVRHRVLGLMGHEQTFSTDHSSRDRSSDQFVVEWIANEAFGHLGHLRLYEQTVPLPLAAPVDEPAEETEYEPTTDWIGFRLLDEDDSPISGERYTIRLPDGSQQSGTLDSDGSFVIEGITPGTCRVDIPDLKMSWSVHSQSPVRP